HRPGGPLRPVPRGAPVRDVPPPDPRTRRPTPAAATRERAGRPRAPPSPGTAPAPTQSVPSRRRRGPASVAEPLRRRGLQDREQDHRAHKRRRDPPEPEEDRKEPGDHAANQRSDDPREAIYQHAAGPDPRHRPSRQIAGDGADNQPTDDMHCSYPRVPPSLPPPPIG